jgi:hypothetical protein
MMLCIELWAKIVLFHFRTFLLAITVVCRIQWCWVSAPGLFSLRNAFTSLRNRCCTQQEREHNIRSSGIDHFFRASFIFCVEDVLKTSNFRHINEDKFRYYLCSITYFSTIKFYLEQVIRNGMTWKYFGMEYVQDGVLQSEAYVSEFGNSCVHRLDVQRKLQCYYWDYCLLWHHGGTRFPDLQDRSHSSET